MSTIEICGCAASFDSIAPPVSIGSFSRLFGLRSDQQSAIKAQGDSEPALISHACDREHFDVGGLMVKVCSLPKA